MGNLGKGWSIALGVAPCIVSDASKPLPGLNHIDFTRARIVRSRARNGFTLVELLIVILCDQNNPFALVS
jgi:hypothetical protein